MKSKIPERKQYQEFSWHSSRSTELNQENPARVLDILTKNQPIESKPEA
jgi:hypothetical protein